MKLDYPPEIKVTGIDNELSQLCDWGNLESRSDTAEVATVDDFLRRRYLYQLSVKGEAAERAVAQYEEAVLQTGELQSAALADIRGLLTELVLLAASEMPDEGKIHRNLITFQHDTQRGL